jgi:hypothetical protein
MDDTVMDDTVLATFKTIQKAEAYLESIGGSVDDMSADRSLSIVSLEGYELIEMFGKFTVRLRRV